MAEEPVTKWWAVGAKDEATVRKYVSFLYKHSMFGGHVGLHSSIRNEKPNRSLDSTRGMYDMLEVYTLSGVVCQVGSVVNFYTEDTNNTEGTTYVYPCNDTSKPMGYMVTRVEPDVYGICVVSGILEVPLDYEKGSTIPISDYRDYVEYDIVDGAFKFSDSGYPVYNVYQDVDGDWIAIILFGDVKADYEYDGSFAVSIAGVTGSTMYVNVAEGDFVQENERFHFADEDLITDIPLSSGQTLWLNTYLSGSTWSYSFESRNTAPIQSPGGSLWYKIAENVDGKLRQIQYGDIFNDIQHLEVQNVTGSTASIRITGYSSTTFTDCIHLRGIGCSFNTLGQNDIGIIVEGATSGGVSQDLYTAIKGGTPAICLTGSTSYVNIKGGTNANVRLDVGGDIIVDSVAEGYDGDFAVKVTSVDSQTPTTLNVTTNTGSLVFEGRRKDISASSSHVLENGKSVWLKYNALTDVVSKRYSATPYADTHDPNTFIIELAKNVNGKLKQVQFGEIVIAKDKLEATVSDNTASIALYGTTNSVNFIGGSNVSITGTTESDGDVNVVINGGTSGGGSSEWNYVTTSGSYVLPLNNTKYRIYCPQPCDQEGDAIYSYPFNEKSLDQINVILYPIIGHNVPGSVGDYNGSWGDILFILPEIANSMDSVEIQVPDGQAQVIVVSVNGKKIYSAAYEVHSIYSDDIATHEKRVYVYFTSSSITGWHQFNTCTNYEAIINAIDTDGGCWVKFNVE